MCEQAFKRIRLSDDKIIQVGKVKFVAEATHDKSLF